MAPLNKYNTFYLLSILILFISQGCSSLEPFYQDKEQAKKDLNTPLPENPEFEVFLIGDAGEPDLDQQEPVLKLLQQQLTEAGKNSAVVFLGDNIYPKGLPPKEKGEPKTEERKLMERKIDESLKTLKDFKGQPYFIPGNHDWNNSGKNGLEYVKAQAEYIEDYLDNKKVFYPTDGCSGPKVMELTDDLVLLMIDSEWWLHDWDKEPNMNEDCEILTRDRFLVEMQNVIQEYADWNILITMHHPLYTQGPHGGFYTLKQHLFPLTEVKKGAYLPMPGLGSIYPVYRISGGVAQDLPHPKYQELKSGLIDAANFSKEVIFAAGHEHTLQYFKKEGHHFIVSGSGCKENPVRGKGDAAFCHSHTGFFKLYYYPDRSVWMEVYEPRGDGSEGVNVYREKIKEASERKVEKLPDYTFPETDSVETLASDYYEAGKFKRFMLGKHYRDIWTLKTKFAVLDISKAKGGLTPLKKGGGFQTKSLRMEAPDGKQYVIRSVNKDVNTVVPKFLDDTFAEDIMQDQTSTTHPYAALIVPKMAEAAGVYHTNPRIVYVPKQNALGDFVKEFGDELYLFEERPAGKVWKGSGMFGDPDDIINFSKTIKNTQNSYKHQIDQQHVLRSRLFDMLINDWDRHDDQWRWAVFEEKDRTIYRPVPRDRDQALHHKRSGMLPRLSTIPFALRKFQSFEPDIRSMRGMNFNARYFDRAFMNKLTLEDFEAMAKEMQEKLTDEVIEKAVNDWPEDVFAITGQRTIDILKKRRDNLLDFARRQYKILAKEVDVVGTNKNDVFLIHRPDEHSVTISLWDMDKDGNRKEQPYYQRTFHQKETKEVRVYGLKGDDQFVFTGGSGSGLVVRVVGGKGKDEYEDKSIHDAVPKVTRVYDKGPKSKFSYKQDFDFTNTVDRPELNEYDRSSFKYNFNNMLIDFGFNVDDGLLLGGGVMFVQQGWKKEPYKASHVVSGKVSFLTGAFAFRYLGDFEDVLGTADAGFHLNVNAPNFVRNYFGLGNNTIETVPDDINFNQVRMDQGIALGFLKIDVSDQHFFQMGPRLEYIEVLSRSDRFVNDVNPIFEESIFTPKYFAGISAAYQVSTLDNKAMPTQGVRFQLSSDLIANLGDTDVTHARLQSELAFYFTFNPIRTTLASRIGFGHNIGDFFFFHANSIGGQTNVRGLRADRFQGRTSVYQNTELRIKLTKISNHIFSSSIGISGHADFGRVWSDSDGSVGFHHGFGGGLWFSIFDLGVIRTSYTVSDVDQLFNLGVGFFF